MGRGDSRSKYVLLVWIAVVFWGSASPIVRYLNLQGMDSYLVAFLRVFFTFACGTIMLFGSGERPRISLIKSNFFPIIGMSITGVVAFYLFLCLGLQTTEAGKSTLINAINPVFILLLARLILKEPLTKRMLIAMLFAIVGVVLSVVGAAGFDAKNFSFASGDFMFVGTAACFASYVIINRVYGHRLSYMQTFFWMFCFSVIMLLPIFMPRLHLLADITREQWLLLLFMGIFPGTMSFYFWNISVQEIGAGSCGVINSFLPISAIAISALWLGESLTVWQLLGAAAVMLSVWQVYKTKTTAS